MREDAQDGRPKGESIDDAQHELQADDRVDQARQDAFGEDRVLFDELREIVEARRCSTSQYCLWSSVRLSYR